MEKQEFILSSKWCVKNSEKNNEVISEWFTDKLGRKPLDKDKSSYYHYPQEDNACTDSVVKEGYQEISYDEFCKYVLNKPKMKNQTVTKAQLLDLRKQFSCGEWRDEIDNILKANILSETDVYEITEDTINLIENRATDSQKDAINELGIVFKDEYKTYLEEHNKCELKIGDKVLISDDYFWIGWTQKGDEYVGKEGLIIDKTDINYLVTIKESGDTYYFRYLALSKIENKYIPFDFTDDLLGLKVIHKGTKHKGIITYQQDNNVSISVTKWTYQDLYDKFTFLDGSPCGKLV
jgi:hypothetical protein